MLKVLLSILLISNVAISQQKQAEEKIPKELAKEMVKFQKNPNSSESQFYFGNALAKAGKWKEASQMFKKSAEGLSGRQKAEALLMQVRVKSSSSSTETLRIL